MRATLPQQPALLAVFGLAVVIRIVFTAINYQANDDHFTVVRMIADHGSFPATYQLEEAFQPKFFHLVCALVLRAVPVDDWMIGYKLCQGVNLLASIAFLLVLQRFITTHVRSAGLGLLVFALVALNPTLIGINAQLTNDTFVILFVTLALFVAPPFFAAPSLETFLPLATFTIGAALSKGNGLVVFFVLVIWFAAHAIARPAGRLATAGWATAFVVVFLLVVPFAGEYWHRHREHGSPFVTNIPPRPLPDLLARSWVARPGVTSIADSYLTFPLLDLLRIPQNGNEKHHYPAHRTSLWSQLYGRTFFVHFDYHPTAWRNDHPWIVLLGRIVLVLALVPSTITAAGIVVEAARLVRRPSAEALTDEAFLHLATFGGYVAFIVLYTMRFRDFSTMKSIFLYPAALCVTYFFIRGAEWFRDRWGAGALATRTATALLGLLIVCHVVDMAVLSGGVLRSLLARIESYGA